MSRPWPAGRACWPEFAAAAALALVIAIAAWNTRQPLLFGDGPQLLQTWLHRDEPRWMHALYFPWAQLLAMPSSGARSVAHLHLASTVAAALAIGTTYLLTRWFGAGRLASLSASALLASSPAFWFFATTIEIHALHAACVGLATFAIVMAPWRQPVPATILAGVGYGLVYASHKSGILFGPFFLALCALARSRKADPDSGHSDRGHSDRRYSANGRTQLLVIGSVLIGFLAISMLISNRVASGEWSLGIGSTTSFIRQFQQGWSLAHVWSHAIAPLGALLPLTVLGLVRMWRRGMRDAVLALGLALLPVLVFFQWYGEQNRGGYLLGMAPLAVPPAALLIDRVCRRRWSAGLLVALLILHAWLALSATAEGRDPRQLAHLKNRARVARQALGDRGVLVSVDPYLQPVTLLAPGIEEVCLTNDLIGVARAGTAPTTFAHLAIRQVEALRRGDAPIGFELGDTSADPGWRDYIDQLARTVRGLPLVREVRSSGGTILVMDPR